MEEKKEVTHSLHLEQRGQGLITGVTEMKSFDEENIFMETSRVHWRSGEAATMYAVWSLRRERQRLREK